MGRLILIKHASPQVTPAVPAREWTLSDKGRGESAVLAERIRRHNVEIDITSDEPKAVETGRIVAEILGVPARSAPGLHEHDRSNVPHMPTREFISSVALMFQKPEELVLGRETARQALDRFRAGLDSVLGEASNRSVAVVTHGTVLALFAASYLRAEPFQLWRRLGLPSFIAFETPSMRAIESVERVEGQAIAEHNNLS
ncbi:MAG: histidine phosphatase family protein [Tepidisphaeraceae bacterium]